MPNIIQTDNGFEFTHNIRTSEDIKHPLDRLCETAGITHQLIRPRTPRLTKKVEEVIEMIMKDFIGIFHFIL